MENLKINDTSFENMYTSTEIEVEVEGDVDLFTEIESEVEEDNDLSTEIEVEVEVQEDIDLFKLNPSKSENINRNYNGSGVMSIVNSKCGKRISFTEKSMEKLNNPKKLQFAYNEDTIAVGEKMPNGEKGYTVKTTGKKYIVYAAKLVDEFTEELRLDFTKKTSMTFYDVKYTSYEGSPVAVIKVKDNNH